MCISGKEPVECSFSYILVDTYGYEEMESAKEFLYHSKRECKRGWRGSRG